MNITPIAAAIGNVTVSRSRTVNLGNYENEQAFVSVTVPVASGQDYDAVYSEALAFVNAKLEEEVAEITGRSVNKVAKARPAKKEAVEEKAETTEEQPVASAGASTEKAAPMSEVRKHLKEVKDEFGNEAYREILMEFGCKAVKDIQEDDHNAIIEKCKAKMSETEEVEEPEEELTEESSDVPEDDGAEESDDDLDGDDDLGEEESSVTKEDVTAALKEYNAENGAKSHLKVLKKFGVTKVAELKESDYAKVIAECL